LLDQVLTEFDRGGLDAARAALASGRGDRTMAMLRSAIGDMQAIERARVDQRTMQERLGEQTTRNLLRLTVLLSLLVLVGAAVVINRDLSRRLRTEDELRRTMRVADDANRAKSEFLSTVSHEIRTPLNVVIGMTQLLRESRLSSEQHEFARSVQANAEMLVQMVGDLLDSFKIEAGQVDIESIPFDARDVVEVAGEILAVRADVKDLDFSVTVDPEVPPLVTGDPNRLRQILLNLIGNAIKFTASGAVAVDARSRPLDDGRLELVVAVADTGIGIAAEDLGKIFQPFVQADASTTRRFGGTGLGLSIASNLARLMGGSISVESEKGRGSTFTLMLPVGVEKDTAPRARPDLTGIRVLAAIENEARARGVSVRLSAAGAVVDVAASAAHALKLAGEESFDVAVVDDRLRHCRGLIQRLRGGDGSNPVIVALCSLSTTLLGDTGSGREVAECVFKPVREARLLAAVARVTNRDPNPDVKHALPVAAREAAGRILVVEDNPDNWAVVSRALRSEGYEVELALDGTIAVQAVRDWRYDLILMDVEMPVMDGFTATKEIRDLEREERRSPAPIVALTAHATRGFRERCLDSGMDDYATKPITRQRLLEIVTEWLDTRPVILIADDAPENHVLVRHFLGAEAFRFVSAHDGNEVLRVLRTQRVSAVLLDMDMPLLNGYEAVSQIRQNPRWNELPVIAMTGYAGGEEQQKCIAAGCSAYVGKPIRKMDLTLAVRRALHATHSETGEARAAGVVAGTPLPNGEASSHGGTHVVDEVQSRLTRIGRLLNRLDFDAALPLAMEVRMLLDQSRSPRAARVARELQRALEEGEEQSAVFWSSRLLVSLIESERLAALHESGLLDSEPEEVFDRLTREIVARLKVPMALISLVDDQRQFFKSAVGLDACLAEARGTPLSHSFCQYVVAAAEPLVVADARQHPIVQNNLAIPDLGVIAYAGVPIRTGDGFVLGSLCAIDNKPREWSENDLRLLHKLAGEAEREIEKRAQRGAPVSARASVATSEAQSTDPTLELLAKRFLETRHEEAVAWLPESLDAGELAQVARFGHQLKGSAGTFGFPEVGAEAAELERAALDGDVHQAKLKVQSLRALLASALDGRR
jgi:signal transduction histidine kinase/CheY-like chemotaxis protein/GAF domain-containing protein